MGNGTKDVALVFNGGEPFNPETPPNRIKRDKYDARVKQGGVTRDLLSQSFGVSEVKTNLGDVMKLISTHVGGKFDTIGRVCLMGRSDGCSLALALAVKLNENGVVPNFIGVSDVTMFPFGSNPAIDEIGDLKPENAPQVGVGVGVQFLIPGLRIGLLEIAYPSMPSNVPPPNVRLTRTIRADKKVNLFQTNGNHTKLTSSSGWVWWSNMKDGEVHGTVEGFTPERRPILGISDLGRHVKLNLGEHWDKMLDDAASELAAF